MDKRMKINILGSGTCVPSLNRKACSALIRFQETFILLDAGPGTMGQMLKLGVSIDEIDAVCLTHFHLDHCAEVAPFLFATKYPGFNRKKPLTLMGGPGLLEWFQGLSTAFNHTIDLPEKVFNSRELSGTGSFELGGLAVTHAPMAHKSESMGFRFQDSTGFSIVYSGDTDVTENLVGLAENADILICESSMPDGMKVPGHLTPSLAGEMAGKAGVGTLVLTHFYPECETVDVKAQCMKSFNGPVIAAEDLMAL
jgi:ribonuclease BN (tRNA processing enzyme)